MVVCEGIAKWVWLWIGLALLGFRQNKVTTLTFVVKWSVDQRNLPSLVSLNTPSSGWRVRCVKLADFLPLLVWRIFTVLLSHISWLVYGFSLRWGYKNSVCTICSTIIKIVSPKPYSNVVFVIWKLVFEIGYSFYTSI